MTLKEKSPTTDRAKKHVKNVDHLNSNFSKIRPFKTWPIAFIINFINELRFCYQHSLTIVPCKRGLTRNECDSQQSWQIIFQKSNRDYLCTILSRRLQNNNAWNVFCVSWKTQMTPADVSNFHLKLNAYVTFLVWTSAETKRRPELIWTTAKFEGRIEFIFYKVFSSLFKLCSSLHCKRPCQTLKYI